MMCLFRYCDMNDYSCVIYDHECSGQSKGDVTRVTFTSWVEDAVEVVFNSATSILSSNFFFAPKHRVLNSPHTSGAKISKLLMFWSKGHPNEKLLCEGRFYNRSWSFCEKIGELCL